ncbi:Zinc finger, CCHC domain-containing protein [Dipsacomyces acuminosporus]|nr:Zinc finger, CCHC domain-containing protein [Dipsacomyces acuminosporus]
MTEPNLSKRFPDAKQLAKYIGKDKSIAVKVELFEHVSSLLKDPEHPSASTLSLLKQLKKKGINESKLGCRLFEWVKEPVLCNYFTLTRESGSMHYMVSLTDPSVDARQVRQALIAHLASEFTLSLHPNPPDSPKISQEIGAFAQQSLATQPQYQSVNWILERIWQAAGRVQPGEYSVEVFGSARVGIATQESDLDIVIIAKHLQSTKNFMHALGRELRSLGMVNCFCIAHAKVPLVSCVDSYSGIACDITFNNTLGLRKSDLLQAYMACDPRVTPLVIAVKYWAKCRHISDASMGFMNSFGFTLMLLAYLQRREVIPALQMVTDFCKPSAPFRGIGRLYHRVLRHPRYNEKPLKQANSVNTDFAVPGHGQWTSPNNESLFQLLYGFFYYYAVQHRIQGDAISVRVGVTDLPMKLVLGGKPDANKKRDKLWYIEDPFEPGVNVAKGMLKNQVGIYREFQTAAFVLKDHLFPLFDSNLALTHADKLFMHHCHQLVSGKTSS